MGSDKTFISSAPEISVTCRFRVIDHKTYQHQYLLCLNLSPEASKTVHNVPSTSTSSTIINIIVLISHSFHLKRVCHSHVALATATSPKTLRWDTLSPIIIQVENYPTLNARKVMLQRPIFHFHDCGRKSKLAKKKSFPKQGSLYYQPKQCTIGEIPQMYHTFALLDPPKTSNLMTPTKWAKKLNSSTKAVPCVSVTPQPSRESLRRWGKVTVVGCGGPGSGEMMG